MVKMSYRCGNHAVPAVILLSTCLQEVDDHFGANDAYPSKKASLASHLWECFARADLWLLVEFLAQNEHNGASVVRHLMGVYQQPVSVAVAATLVYELLAVTQQCARHAHVLQG
jgi:hypothetical protein